MMDGVPVGTRRASTTPSPFRSLSEETREEHRVRSHGPLTASLIWLCVLCAGCGSPSSDSAPRSGSGDGGRAVTVFGAASTTNALGDLCRAFTRMSGAKVVTNFASSSTLAQQIVNGAEADLFLSANVRWADAVQAEGMVAERVDLLGNRLVVIVPVRSGLRIRTIRDLVTVPIERLALADPSSVPAGIYAKKSLENLGLWTDLERRAAAGADVRQALAYVEQGAADAGIVYATDAAISDRVKVAAEVPENACPLIVYPLVLLKRAAGDGNARALYAYLRSEDAAAVFEKYGFTIRVTAGVSP
jgi:molybdate transport system substrate-binding protein